MLGFLALAFDIPWHCSPRPSQVLMSFKKAYELNGKPEVYGPLASCADALVRWMVVRGLGACGVAEAWATYAAVWRD